MSEKTKARTYIVSFEDYWNENNSHLKKETAKKRPFEKTIEILPPTETLLSKSSSGKLVAQEKSLTPEKVVEKRVVPYRIEKTTTEEVFLPEFEIPEKKTLSDPSVPRKTEKIIEEEIVSEIQEKIFTREEIKNYLNNMYIIKNKTVAFGKTNADYFHSITNVEKGTLNLSNNYKKINFRT
jgi:hypothetical protein